MTESRKAVDVGELINEASNPDVKAQLLLMLSISTSLSSIEQELREFTNRFLKANGPLSELIETSKVSVKKELNPWTWPKEILDKPASATDSSAK